MHRDNSVTLIFNYHDGNGELITEFSVGPERYRLQLLQKIFYDGYGLSAHESLT